ncbi:MULTISPECIES: DsrE family protein [unclassified Guyparkeria]|uniref:DsrE family protein n=1 Tax=unclassified Guyparkeria TaxID=2626246 RepID=UPI000733422C|nr:MULTISPECIES: DsrE family protein [unclassified Guyparkeria]KTG17519.1 hypothetical protein AUR63_07625 [Guyparkeria sp. XI15]OAE88334.1 hypothetical protein AWR35_07640 [Guyparkeria sp. WRN-7]
MSVVKRLMAGLFVAFALLTSGQVLAGDEDKTFFYNITTDEVWPAGMASAQAYNAAKRGHDVIAYLNVRGVYLAAKDRQQDTLGATGRTAQETLKMAIENGARVLVCPMCMRQGGLSPDDLIDGVELGKPEMLFELLSRDEVVALSY